MAKIKFERISAPTGSVQFSRNPSIIDGGISRSRKYLQPKDWSDGGDLYIYNKGISAKNYLTLSFGNNPVVDYNNLLTFLGVVIGSVYNFTLTNSDGTTNTARIMNSDEFRSAPVMTERESFEIDLLIES